MATIGDPLMDLGNGLAYWIEAGDPAELHLMRRQPSHLDGMLSRQQLVEYYTERAGIISNGGNGAGFGFYQVFGLFRLVVIFQQMYFRYYHGQTKDSRFAGFGHLVNYLQGYLLNTIEQYS